MRKGGKNDRIRQGRVEGKKGDEVEMNERGRENMKEREKDGDECCRFAYYTESHSKMKKRATGKHRQKEEEDETETTTIANTSQQETYTLIF